MKGEFNCFECGVTNYAELPEEFPKNITLLDLMENNVGSTVLSAKQVQSEKFTFQN